MKRKIKLRTLVFLGLIFVLVPIVIFTLFRPSPTQAEWFNDAWGYRQSWSFTHNAALSDRRVTFTIDTQPLTTDKLQADCDDIRFTDNSGKLLRFQLTSACDLVSTTFDVIVLSVVNGLNAGYIYYGNPGSSSASEDISSFTSLSPSGGAPAFASEQKGEGPIGYWAMDEGTDNTCSGGTKDGCDATSNANDVAFGATTTAPTWQTEDKCIAGKCLFFDGSQDDIATITNTGTIAGLGDSGDSFTVSFWTKVGSGVSANQAFVTKRTGGGWYIGSQTTTSILVYCFNWSTQGHTFPYTFRDNRWHNIQMVKSNTTIKLYIDGAEVTPSAGGTGASGDCSFAQNILLGQDAENTDELTGFMDEVKIYNYARTAAQIKTDFAGKGTSQGVSARFGQQDTAFLNNGLVGYWPMDESAVNSCIGGVNDNCDKSGNGNDGAWTGDATSVGAKFGNGATFDGTGDYVDMTDPASGVLDFGASTSYSYGVWFNTTDTNVRTFFAKYAGNPYYMVSVNVTSTGSIRCATRDTDGDEINTIVAGSWNDGAWHHVFCVGDRASKKFNTYVDGILQLSMDMSAIGDVSNTGIFQLGALVATSNYYSGKLDDARVYSRALSASEVKNLYNWAPGPVGYWKMDEGTGTTANDSSGNGLTGTLTTGQTWGNGKFGGSPNFDAIDDLVTVSDNALLDTVYDLTASAWIKTTSNGGTNVVIAKSAAGNSTTPYMIYTTLGKPTVLFGDGSGIDVAQSATTIHDGIWHHVSATIRDTSIRLYVDGVEVATGTFAGTRQTNTNILHIGKSNSGAVYFDGQIDDVRFYNYARTAQQIVEDMNGGHPAGGSPVSSQVIYYAMNEQTGSVLNNRNSTQASLTGTITGATWKTKENCREGGCLDFDGADDTATTTNATAIDLNDNLASGFTIGGWIYPDTAGEGSGGRIFTKNTNTWLRVDTLSGGFLDIQGSLDLATDATLNVSAKVTQSAWNHVAMSFTDDADDEITIWVNGTPVGTSSDGAGATSADTAALTIGNETGATTQTFDGKIDEFKVYSSELTADQMKMEANFGGSLNFGAGTDEAATAYGGPGGNPPVAYWNLDERTGTSANDISGNGLIGTLTGGPTWTSGKIGSALYFDGSGDYVTAGDPTSLRFTETNAFTIESWFKLQNPDFTNTMEGVVDKRINNDRYMIVVNSSFNIVIQISDGTNVLDVTGATTLSNNQWYHVALVYDGANNLKGYINGKLEGTDTSPTLSGLDTTGANFEIGREATNNRDFNGIIDDVKVYNYARTASQIAYDYNRGGPVAWWRFNECSGTTLNDAANNGNNGTWSGATGSQTSAGTCSTASTAWGNGSTGKFSSSLNFDGTDDKVSIPSSSTLQVGSGDLTLAAWLKPSTLPSCAAVFDKGLAGNREYGVFLACGAVNQVFVQLGVGGTAMMTTSTNFATGAWQLLTLTRSGSAVTLYKNGLIVGTATISTITTDSNALSIGNNVSGGGSNFDGQIDEVQIFNYPLSAIQVKKIYNDNSGARFGPLTGSP